MFGNCVWAQLSSTHFINQNIYNFTHLFHLPQFKAHLTLDYNLEKPFKKENYIFRRFDYRRCSILNKQKWISCFPTRLLYEK